VLVPEKFVRAGAGAVLVEEVAKVFQEEGVVTREGQEEGVARKELKVSVRRQKPAECCCLMRETMTKQESQGEVETTREGEVSWEGLRRGRCQSQKTRVTEEAREEAVTREKK
jgi:hypothetical protein